MKKDTSLRRRRGLKRREAAGVKTLATTRIYLPDIEPGPIALRLVKALKEIQT